MRPRRARHPGKLDNSARKASTTRSDDGTTCMSTIGGRRARVRTLLVTLGKDCRAPGSATWRAPSMRHQGAERLGKAEVGQKTAARTCRTGAEGAAHLAAPTSLSSGASARSTVRRHGADGRHARSRPRSSRPRSGACRPGLSFDGAHHRRRPATTLSTRPIITLTRYRGHA